jgi:hypothetical protein
VYLLTSPYVGPGPILPSELIIYSPPGIKKVLSFSGFLTPDEAGNYMRIQLCNNDTYESFATYVRRLSKEEFDQSVVWVKQDVWTIMSFPLPKLLSALNPMEGERPRSDWYRAAFADVRDINNYPCSLTIWTDPNRNLYVGCRREE